MHRATPLVLLADQDSDSAKSFQKVFAKVALHWQHVWVKDGREAVHHMIYNGFPDLIVTRAEIPKLNALDVVEWVRSMKSFRVISIIVWEKTPPRTLQTALSDYTGIEYLHSEMPEMRLKRTLMQIVAKTEVAIASAGAISEQTSASLSK